jgi:hypothetical protein
MAILVSDPTYVPEDVAGRGGPTVGARLALRFIHDARDIPFLRLSARIASTVLPMGVLLFVPGVFRWWLSAIHLGLVLHFLSPFVLMLHNTSHRRLFKAPWGRLNLVIPWVLGPFFGESPETYFTHHIGMHHPENNVPPDLSSTVGYQRDSVASFARYFLRFFFAGPIELPLYFWKKGRRTLMKRAVVGELSFYALVALLGLVEWRAALTVFVVPFVVARFAMMAGNWAQHAFVDGTGPENNYRNSITCINCAYNRRCFNDGYHIGHHLKATRHWTEMPVDFLANRSTYVEEEAIVFEGIDFLGVWARLMLKRYDSLARHVVHLGDSPRSIEETIAILKSRTRRIRVSSGDPNDVSDAAVRS